MKRQRKLASVQLELELTGAAADHRPIAVTVQQDSRDDVLGEYATDLASALFGGHSKQKKEKQK